MNSCLSCDRMVIPFHIRRILVHLLLAGFVANAANKFFVADLDYEAVHSFYARIFDFQGDAPDQYRILPLMPIKLLCEWVPFHLAVLIFNFCCTFLVLELFAGLLRGMDAVKVFGFNVAFSALYIYTQYTGWRPDTMGLVLFATLMVWAAGSLKAEWVKQLAIVLGVAVLSWSRADFALALAVFYAIYHVKAWVLRVVLVLVPIGTQVFLQFVLFSEARYYTQSVMILDNLSGYYLIRNPATYLILAAAIAFWPKLKAMTVWIFRQYPAFLFIFAGYFLLVLVVGRVNEYRIFLPFCPLILTFWREATWRDEEETGAV